MISIIYPSYGRPLKIGETYQNWYFNVYNKQDVEFIIVLNNDDPDLEEYRSRINIMSLVTESNPKVIVGDYTCLVDAANAGAKEATGDILMLISDDMWCGENNFDLAFRWFGSIEGKTDFICHIRTGDQNWLITLPVMDRTYYERFGYIYNPIYKHLWADTEMTCVGHLLDKVIELPIDVVHAHYHVQKAQFDETYRRGFLTHSEGEQLFLKRAAKKFGVKKPKGEIKDEMMLQYFNEKEIHIYDAAIA